MDKPLSNDILKRAAEMAERMATISTGLDKTQWLVAAFLLRVSQTGQPEGLAKEQRQRVRG